MGKVDRGTAAEVVAVVVLGAATVLTMRIEANAAAQPAAGTAHAVRSPAPPDPAYRPGR